MPPTTRWTAHVTVAAVIEHEGRYLMVEEQTPDGLRLNQPAGHLDPGEAPAEAAIRECLEESARVFVPEAFLGVFIARTRRARPIEAPRTADDDVTYVRLAYCGRAGDALPGRALDAPIVRTLWMTAGEIDASRARHRSPLVARCIAAHRAGVRWPLDAVVVDPSVLFDGDGAKPFV